MPPSFLLLTGGLVPLPACQALCAPLAERAGAVLGFTPRVQALSMSLEGAMPVGESSLPALDAAIDAAVEASSDEVFLLPAVLDLAIHHKQLLVESVRCAQRRHPDAQVYYDGVDPCHPLLLHAFVDAAARALGEIEGATPGRVGLLLVAPGEGDPESRAESYKLMRLLWEQLGCIRGEVAFLRHDRTPLPEQLEACDRVGLDWIVVPQLLWASDHLEYVKLISDDFNRQREAQRPWPVAPSVGDHPNVVAWLQQRMTNLWLSHRDRRAARIPSARYAEHRSSQIHGPGGAHPLGQAEQPLPVDHQYGTGLIADLADPADLAILLGRYGLAAERIFVKVTWHGYATGTYTDPIALDALLSALPGKAVVMEGHTAGRNRGGAEFDWEREARAHRVWIAQQDREFLQRTGLQDVLDRHGATYLNTTEAHWDGACAEPQEVKALLEARGVQLAHPELASYVPRVLLEHLGAPMISFARFKGPTRLSLSNLFGLIPDPLRTAWHGPNLTYTARVCCDLAKLYGALFDLHGLVESLHVAVRWDRQGMYRSRYGNYDLISNPGLVTLAPSPAEADVLASRLQGQDVRRSAFFDVVRSELGDPSAASDLPIDGALIRRFV